MRREDNYAFKEENHVFRDMVINSMFGQIIADENLNLYFTNNRMFDYFQMKPYKTAGLSFGKAFKCVEIERDCSECGKSEKCLECGILLAMQEVQLNDLIIENSLVPYVYNQKKHHELRWFQINGRRLSYLNKRYITISFADVTVLKCLEQQLKTQLSLDLATGTMNKSSLLNAVKELLNYKSECQDFTICMIDFDNFKTLNDQYGHLAGDKVLEIFSTISRKHIRKKDILGRFGGEEFIFVFFDVDEARSISILNRIHKELGAYFSKKLKTPVTFSAGIVYMNSKSCAMPSYSMLLNEVDRFLYQAKNKGRGRAMSSLGETLFG